jgi:hypothetical protein
MTTEELEKYKKNASDFIPTEVKSVFLKRRQDTMNLNGWGFTDSIFTYQKGQLVFTGERFVSNNIQTPRNVLKENWRISDLHKKSHDKFSYQNFIFETCLVFIAN